MPGGRDSTGGRDNSGGRESTGGRNNTDRSLFAQEMIAMRRQRGWNQEVLAAKMIVSSSTVANIESGYRAPTPAQAIAADEAFGTPGTFQRHERHMRGIPLSAGFRPFEPHEKEAHTLRTFEHSVVPGLFQTEDYARAILATFPDTTAEVVKDRVDGRMERQEILRRDDPPPPHIWAVLDEHVLNRTIGGPAVMAVQMERMAELAHMPRINVQVIPADTEHPGLMGAFVVAETGQSPAIVFMENASDGQTIEDAEMAAKMTVLFDSLRMEALTGSASLNLIEEAAQRWKERIASLRRGASPVTAALAATTA